MLTAGVDYTVAFSENVEPGQATVMVTGTGAYEGSLTVTFAIVKADTSELAAAIEQARAIEQGKKSDDAFAELTNAIAVAQAVVDKPAATQEELADAIAKLGDAVKSFNDSPDQADQPDAPGTDDPGDKPGADDSQKGDSADKPGAGDSGQSGNTSTVTPGGTVGGQTSAGDQGTAVTSGQNSGKASASLATTGDASPVAAAGATGILAALAAAVSQVLRRRKSED